MTPEDIFRERLEAGDTVQDAEHAAKQYAETGQTYIGPETLTIDQYFFGYRAGRNLDLDSALQRFLRAQLRTGGWHPDDTEDEQRNGRTGALTFTPELVPYVAADIETIREAGIDPCGIGLAAFPAHLPKTKWSDEA